MWLCRRLLRRQGAGDLREAHRTPPRTQYLRCIMINFLAKLEGWVVETLRDFMKRLWMWVVLTKVMRKPWTATNFFASCKHGVTWPCAGNGIITACNFCQFPFRLSIFATAAGEGKRISK